MFIKVLFPSSETLFRESKDTAKVLWKVPLGVERAPSFMSALIF